MPRDARPEADVITLIESGSLQCRQAADACREKGTKKKCASPTRAAAPHVDPFAESPQQAHPLLDEPRRVPPCVQKMILDADDV